MWRQKDGHGMVVASPNTSLVLLGDVVVLAHIHYSYNLNFVFTATDIINKNSKHNFHNDKRSTERQEEPVPEISCVLCIP